MTLDESLERQIQMARGILDGSAGEDDVKEAARLFLEMDGRFRGGEAVPQAWTPKRCRMRWTPGAIRGLGRDPDVPTVRARCKLPEGHPEVPGAKFEGHVWGDDAWPEYPGGKPPGRS